MTLFKSQRENSPEMYISPSFYFELFHLNEKPCPLSLICLKQKMKEKKEGGEQLMRVLLLKDTEKDRKMEKDQSYDQN